MNDILKKIFFVTTAGLLTGIVFVMYAGAHGLPLKVEVGGKSYYVVSGDDPDQNSGEKVCALIGRSCVGYTATNLDACKAAHPGARTLTSVNGSKSPFFCDGSPQKGIACENQKNLCQVCPNCNINADCNTQIGDQFKEMFVECSGEGNTDIETIQPSANWRALINAWFSSRWTAFRNSVSAMRNNTMNIFKAKLIKKATIKVQGPKGETSVELPADVVACEFYQVNKKHVTCAAYKAADTFCTQVMQSRHARAALCQEDGLVVCTNPCTPPDGVSQVPIKQCAFDNDRARGKQAPPLDFCNQTVTAKMPPSGKGVKKPGEVCSNGGDCTTGFCLGQPSDSGIKYFCSCSQSKHDTTSCR